MVRAITVLATFRSSRNSCIGLLENNIRIECIDIDFRRAKKNDNPNIVYLCLGCLFSSFLLACLLRARARKKEEKRQPKHRYTGRADDSGYK